MALLEGLSVLEEQVVGAVQLRDGGAQAGGHAQHFEHSGGFLQPAQGLALGGGVQHADNEQGAGDLGVAQGCAAGQQQALEAELVEGMQAEAFGTGGARGVVLQGV